MSNGLGQNAVLRWWGQSVVWARNSSCGFASQARRQHLAGKKQIFLPVTSGREAAALTERYIVSRCGWTQYTAPCFRDNELFPQSWRACQGRLVKPWKWSYCRGTTQSNARCSQQWVFASLGIITVGWFECCTLEISKGALGIWFRFHKNTVDRCEARVSYQSHLLPSFVRRWGAAQTRMYGLKSKQFTQTRETIKTILTANWYWIDIKKLKQAES